MVHDQQGRKLEPHPPSLRRLLPMALPHQARREGIPRGIHSGISARTRLWTVSTWTTSATAMSSFPRASGPPTTSSRTGNTRSSTSATAKAAEMPSPRDHGIDPIDLPDPTADERWSRFRWDGVTRLVESLAEAVHEIPASSLGSALATAGERNRSPPPSSPPQPSPERWYDRLGMNGRWTQYSPCFTTDFTRRSWPGSGRA